MKLLDSDWLTWLATHPPLLVVEATIGGVLITTGDAWTVALGIFLVAGAALNSLRAWAMWRRP